MKGITTIMKRFVLAVLLLAGGALSLHAQTSTFQSKYTDEHPLIYEDAWDLWPYVFFDENGNAAGYNVDLLTMIFKELDIPFVIYLKPTSQALDDLHRGKSDLMMGMVANFHDNENMHYGKMPIQLFTHSVAHPKGVMQHVRTFADLSSQKVIVHEGSFSHHLMEDHGWGDNAIPNNDMDKVVQLVSSLNEGQVLWNTMSLKWLMHKFHTDNLELSPVDMPSGDYRFMANDEKLLELLDATYSKLKAQDRLIPIERKWFYPEEAPVEGLPQWLWWVVAAIALATLLLIASLIFYKLRERKVTRQGRKHINRLALIMKACQVKIWTYDLHKKVFVWLGNSYQDVKTYAPREFARRYSTDDFKRMMVAINKLANSTSNAEQMEIKMKDGDDGSEHVYLVRMSVLKHVKGTPTVIIGTKTDITEEKLQQQVSNELMHRYEAIFNSDMVDMVYYESDGLITNMNQRSQNTFHMNLDDVLRDGVRLSDILSPSDFDMKDFATTDHFNTTMFLDYSKERYVASRKVQGKMAYELQLVPVYGSNKQMLGAYGTGRVVTEVADTYRKARQGVKQLRKATQKVADHVNNINYVLQVGGVRMVSYSPQTHLLSISHRLHEAQYVLTQQRCIGLTDDISQRQVMRMLRTMDRRLNTSIDAEVRSTLRLPGGHHLWLHLHLFPVLDDEGHVQQYAGLCRDTTQIKHTEHMLLLESEKAQEIEQVKNKFLHNMCYEIRTPLDTVVGFAEMFDTEHSKDEEEMFIQQIKENSTYLLNLINDILFLSRLDAHMVEINPQPTEFAHTFEGHCHMAFADKKREGVKYVVENNYEHLVVNIDDANLGRIIRQILENAVEHTTHGSVRARYDYIGGKLVIGVSDTGEGIPQQKLEHIFERFNTSNEQSKGTGLGLPICMELATQLGGTIDISSEVGKGTSVWVTIPCEATLVERKTDE